MPAVPALDAHEFLRTLAVVLMVAAGTSVLFQRLRLPVVFGYLAAGMIVGPYTSIPFVANEAIVQSLSELGVILLMFSIGLEFRLRRVGQVAGTAGIAALLETGLMFGLGALLADLLGWTPFERLVAGAMVAISSTTIIARTFAELKVGGRVAELVFGVLIIEDLIAIVLLATLGALATGGGLGVTTIGITLVQLGTFLTGLLAVGLLVVPRFMRAVIGLGRDETTLVAAVGVCFGAALLALSFGYSVALGAFVAGSLVAESGQSDQVEHLVHPVRDVFVAIFFVSVGMLLDPGVVRAHLGTIIAFTVLVMGGKTLAASMGAFLSGAGLRTSVQAGLSLAQIGEFSFLIATLGVAAGARNEIFTIAVAVSAITTLATPTLVKRAGGIAALVDRKLPHRLQTFAALYGSWIARLRASTPHELPRRRRLTRRLALDSALLAVIIIGAIAERGRFATLLHGWIDVEPERGELLVRLGAIALALPVVAAVFLTARHLAGELALQALPLPGKRLDTARAPRRALTATFHIGLTSLALVVPLLLLQPLLPRYSAPAIVGGFLVLLVGAVWQATRDLEGHARAGAEVIATALVQELDRNTESHDLTRTMERMVVMLPGLGEPVLMTVAPGSRCDGRTLGEVDLRGLTGATVMAITKDAEGKRRSFVPTATERLDAGDLVAIAGAPEAIEQAREMIEHGTAPPIPIAQRGSRAMTAVSE
ncbi:MAG: cation:proton antiporter [Gemmatimonadetes bacterium]|nr:cation:proton antiporter [Gemmatimonadota bacterium]MBP7551092.1 cation:proton antiporter [Gemmatimonadaceae bacterium]